MVMSSMTTPTPDRTRRRRGAQDDRLGHAARDGDEDERRGEQDAAERERAADPEPAGDAGGERGADHRSYRAGAEHEPELAGVDPEAGVAYSTKIAADMKPKTLIVAVAPAEREPRASAR